MPTTLKKLDPLSGRDTIQMRWVLAHDPASTFEPAARMFAQSVREESEGRLQVEVITKGQYSQGKPVSPAEIVRQVGSGRLEMCQTYTTSFGKLYDNLWSLDLPFLFKDHAHAARVLDGSIGGDLMCGLLPHGIRGLAFTYSGGFRVVATSGKEIRKAEDFSGLRVRTSESPVAQRTMETLGATAVPALLEDVAGLMADRRIDAAECTYPRYWEQNIRAGSRVVCETRHSLLLTMMVVNEDFYRRLPEDLKAVVQKAAKKAALMERAQSIQDGKRVKRECVKEGIKVVAMSAAERSRLAKKVKPVYDEFVPRFGSKLIAGIRAA